jgi:hypothetical protein
MGKKKKPPPQWAVHLETIYRRDHDERIDKIFALVLPVISSKPTQIIVEEETENESAKPHRHLRSSIK